MVVGAHKVKFSKMESKENKIDMVDVSEENTAEYYDWNLIPKHILQKRRQE